MRTRIRNQLQALAMNEGRRRKMKLWSAEGRAELEKLALAPWASRLREELLELLDRLDPTIEESSTRSDYLARLHPGSIALLMKSVADPDPTMTSEERAYVTQLLKDSLTEYLSHVESVSEAQWNWTSVPGRWSIGETAEHIMLNEAFLFGVIQRALQSPPDPEWQNKTAGKSDLLERLMPDRSRKAIAPEPVHPKGLPKQRVIRQFKQLRSETLHFAETTQLPLKAHTREHPFPVFGTLNAYQWLLYIPLHHKRHNQQIAVAMRPPLQQ